MSLFEAFSVPRANVSVQAVHGFLGHVLRDIDVLRDLLGDLSDKSGDAHRNIWVALALLGDLVEPEVVGLDLASFEDASTWVLAAVLAD